MPRNFFSISFVILLLMLAASAQPKPNSAIEKQIKSLNVEKNVQIIYDEAGGTSKVFATGEDFGRDADKRAGVKSFSFGMAFFYAGKALTFTPDEINLTFWVMAKKPQFAAAHHLTVTVGNETLDLGDARYVSKPNEKMEYLNFKIRREFFAKIAKSPNAKIKIGNAEFQFTPEHLKTFAAMIKISDPSVL